MPWHPRSIPEPEPLPSLAEGGFLFQFPLPSLVAVLVASPLPVCSQEDGLGSSSPGTLQPSPLESEWVQHLFTSTQWRQYSAVTVATSVENHPEAALLSNSVVPLPDPQH